ERGHLHHLGVAVPLRRDEPLLRELLHDALGVRLFAVDLVDGDDDRDLGRLRVVQRLDGLRHHPVVGGDDEHDDVGGLRAARPHGGERLVARRVDERDRAAVALDLVRADVLRDATGLAGDDVGVADVVEQLRLAVVDVTHDGDDRRTGLEVGVVLVLLVGEVEQLLELDLLLLTGVDEANLRADLGREQLDHVVRERLRGGDHLALLHEEAHDVGRGAVQLRAEVLRRRGALDDDRALGHGRGAVRVRRRLERLQLLAVATATTTLAGARRAPVGAAAAGRTAGAATRTTAGAATGTATEAGAAAEATAATTGTAAARRTLPARGAHGGTAGAATGTTRTGRHGTASAHAGGRRDRLAGRRDGGAAGRRRDGPAARRHGRVARRGGVDAGRRGRTAALFRAGRARWGTGTGA